jgi:hypothetical protein
MISCKAQQKTLSAVLFFFLLLFFVSCSFGKFVKIFHIKGQHTIPAYIFFAEPGKLKTEFKIFLENKMNFVSAALPASDYKEGMYYVQLSDSLSKQNYCVRFGIGESDTLQKATTTVVKIYSAKYPGEENMQAFFSRKVSAKKRHELEMVMEKNIFSRLNGIKYSATEK